MKTKYADCCFPIVTLPIGDEEYAALMEAWAVSVGPFEAVVVPAGTRTDGASIPRILWPLCGHPLQAPRAYAALFHDYLYSGGVPGCTRAQADKCYFLLLRHYGVSWLKAKTEYCALRMFGWSHWLSSFSACF